MIDQLVAVLALLMVLCGPGALALVVAPALAGRLRHPSGRHRVVAR